jgi:hypothetical protein
VFFSPVGARPNTGCLHARKSLLLGKDREGGPTGQEQYIEKAKNQDDQMEAAYLSLKQ